MKKKILCLALAVLMILPVCLMAGCGNNEVTADDINEQVPVKTLTMFVITERHVYTAEELANIKTEHGEASKEYIEAKNVKDAYDAVAKELDKITKSKFRTHLVVYYYTLEEYKAVEAIMQLQKEAEAIRDEAKKALKKYTKEQKAMGITDTAVIQSMFYDEHPEYAKYTEATTNADDVSSEAETLINEYGIEELKYPDPKSNQIDIVCICGYDKYLDYISKGYLASLDSELDGASKSIMTYVNEKFLTSAQVNGTTYGIPNNSAIGEYTYMLLNKELYDYYQYDYEKAASLSSSDVQDFLKDIKMYRNDYVPLTGELGLINTFFYSLNYEYVEVENIPESIDDFEDCLYYFRTENEDATGDSDKYTYYRVLLKPDKDITYYTAKGTAFTGSAFVSGRTYYTQNSDGSFTYAPKYQEGEKYYTVTFTAEKDLSEFKSNAIYYTKNTDATYSRIYAYDESYTQLFTVNSTSFDSSTFSVLGNVLSNYATLGTLISPNLFKSTNFKNQLITMKAVVENGYYDADAINDPNKKFAAAVVKGGADLADVYGDEYYMIPLEYPRARTSEVCKNLFGVSSSSAYVSAAMQVITYLTINSDFRNLLQYGIVGQNYNVVYVTPEGSTKQYPTVNRINDYYMMDIEKTGNKFIAYPEENMSYKVWEYGKLQNADAKYDPMVEFNVSAKAGKIDFSIVDRIKKLSIHYKEMIDACETVAELTEVLSTIDAELTANALYTTELVHGVQVGDGPAPQPGTYNAYGVYHHYFDWWAPLYYQDE